jgi:NADPH2:quinone reductase
VLDLADSPHGAPVGWDLAGTTQTAAADGSGPAAGTRVVGLVRRGAWAELVAVPTSQLAVLPSTVTEAEAATLPTAVSPHCARSTWPEPTSPSACS